MFRFEEGGFLYLMTIIPVLLIIYLLYRSWVKSEIVKLSQWNLYKRIVPQLSWWKKNLKFFFVLLAMTFLIIAGANPQWGNKKEKVEIKSSDVFIALDISQSMMAEDVSPNRLERAKRLTQNIIRSLKGNRIGLIFFAGNAYLQMPLSSDYASAELFVQSANTNQAGTQGTAIVEAIDLALRAFEEDRDYQRTLIIVTDGENHDDEALSKARTAREQGLIIHTVGVGTEEGGFIPYVDRGRERFKRDQSGNPIRSRLNIELIRDLPAAGDGKYYLIQEGNSLVNDLRSEVEKITKQEVEQRSFTEYASYFQYFIGLGILFLIVEFLISNRSRKLTKKSLFEI